MNKILVTILLLTATLFAQDSFRPHVRAGAEFQLNGGGYNTFSQGGVIGIDFEPKYIFANCFAGYDNAHKTDDGTGNNPNGHDRLLECDAFARPNHFFFGGSLKYVDLHTTNYVKRHTRPGFGGGYMWDSGMYVQGIYRLVGNDLQNRVQGPEFKFFIPFHKYFFYEMELEVYHYHNMGTTTGVDSFFNHTFGVRW